MQFSSRFTIAVHILVCIVVFGSDYKLTSEFLASSVNVNPVVIRNVLSQLRRAGLVVVVRGTGGASLAKPMQELTFLDIYNAVECVEQQELFHFHENPNSECPVGRNIHGILDEKLERVQKTMEQELASISLADAVQDAKRLMNMEI